MIAVDTNLIARLLTGDDTDQADRAERVLRGGDVMLPKTVLLECEWVLRAGYGVASADIAVGLRRLLGLPGVAAEDAPTVARALDWYEGGLDFADALHLASGAGASRFATFDRALARRAKQLGAVPEITSP